MYVAERQRIPRTLWQSLADAGHVTLDLPVEFFPIKLGNYYLMSAVFNCVRVGTVL